MVIHDGRHFLAVGSDHTDRNLERTDIAASKAACPKPMGGSVVALDSDLSSADCDQLAAHSSMDGRPYQRGSVSMLRHPAELVERMTATVGSMPGDLVMFCGTLPLLGGEFVHGRQWGIHLELSGGPTLTHAYETKQRSV